MITPSAANDPRAEVRANVFLAAALAVSGRSIPVRIRNISARGALLDGAALPAEGSSAELLRGSLNVRGEVAWSSAGQCGLRFEEDVKVADWVRRIVHRGQARVDEIVASLKWVAAAGGDQRDKAGAAHDTLASIAADLAGCSARLAASPRLVEEHCEELVALESIAQRLGRFAAGEPGSED